MICLAAFEHRLYGIDPVHPVVGFRPLCITKVSIFFLYFIAMETAERVNFRTAPVKGVTDTSQRRERHIRFFEKEKASVYPRQVVYNTCSL